MWIETEKIKEEILIGDGIECGGKLWCLCSNLNRMYCINVENMLIENRTVFEEISKSKAHLFSKIIKVKKNLYLIPYHSKKMIRYQIDKGKIEYTDFSDLYAECGFNGMFITGCKVGKYIFLFPYKYKNVIRVDTENNQLNFLKYSENRNQGKIRFPFIRRCAVRENMIWSAEDGGDRILQIDTKKMEGIWISLGKNILIRDICIYGEKLFCLDILGKIVVFDTITKKVEVILDLKSDRYGFVEKTEKFIWLIPSGSNQILKYSEEKQMEFIDYPYDFKFSSTILKSKMRTFSNIHSDESKIIIMPRCNNILIKIDKKYEDISFDKISLSEEMTCKIENDFCKKIKKYCFATEKEAKLEWFVEFLKNDKKSSLQNNNKIGTLVYSIIENI